MRTLNFIKNIRHLVQVLLFFGTQSVFTENFLSNSSDVDKARKAYIVFAKQIKNGVMTSACFSKINSFQIPDNYTQDDINAFHTMLADQHDAELQRKREQQDLFEQEQILFAHQLFLQQEEQEQRVDVEHEQSNSQQTESVKNLEFLEQQEIKQPVDVEQEQSDFEQIEYAQDFKSLQQQELELIETDALDSQDTQLQDLDSISIEVTGMIDDVLHVEIAELIDAIAKIDFSEKVEFEFLGDNTEFVMSNEEFDFFSDEASLLKPTLISCDEQLHLKNIKFEAVFNE